MFCPHCGFEAGKCQFCPKCGADIAHLFKYGNISPKNQWAALALSVFFGFFGVHRFYVGKIGTGILYALSGGGFFFGWLMDIYHIANGTFRDKDKLLLKRGGFQPPPAHIPPPKSPPPPIFIPNVAESVKQIVTPVLDVVEQIKRAFVPGAETEPIPWDNTPPAQTVPPPPPREEPVIKPDIRTPMGRCAQAVLDYLRDNESTPFFREKLNAVAAKLVLFAKRSGAVRQIIIERFGASGLTFSKFTAPVAALEEHSIGMTDGLVSKMKLFDEEDCKRRMQELLAAGKYEEMQEYIAFEKNYQESAETTISVLDDALIKLEKLIFEISKLDEAGMDRAADVLDGIDELIRDTPHYS